MSGAASGALVSLLLNKKARKKLGGSMGKVGGAAALAGIGYMAYRQWQESQGPAVPPPAPSMPSTSDMVPPPPPPLNLAAASDQVETTDGLQVKMLLAMVAAAAADGSIDDREMDNLIQAIDAAPISPEAKSELTAALNEPPTVEEIAASVSGPEEASELYGAAFAAIEVDTPAEHMFLRRFAVALNLNEELRLRIHQVVED